MPGPDHLDGWSDVEELDVARHVRRLSRFAKDLGPETDEADGEDRFLVQVRRWQDWLAF